MDNVKRLQNTVDELPGKVIESMAPIIRAELGALELRLALSSATRMTRIETIQGESKERISGIELELSTLETMTQNNKTSVEVVQALCRRNHKDSIPAINTKGVTKNPPAVVKIGFPIAAIGAIITWLITKFTP